MDRLDQPSKKINSPRFLSFLSLSMGMIQPEWLYMSHFFHDPPSENAPTNSSSIRLVPTTHTSPSDTPIQIHFRPRK